jgi:hypothetical protein
MLEPAMVSRAVDYFPHTVISLFPELEKLSFWAELEGYRIIYYPNGLFVLVARGWKAGLDEWVLSHPEWRWLKGNQVLCSAFQLYCEAWEAFSVKRKRPHPRKPQGGKPKGSRRGLKVIQFPR